MEKEKSFLPILSDRLEYVTLSLTLDTRKREDSLPVAVRVNANRKTIYHRTGLRCTLNEWEAIRKSSKRGDKFETKKSQIAIFEKVRKNVFELLEDDSFTFDNLKVRLTGKDTETFSKKWVEVANSKKVGTKDAYLTAYNSFEKYVGKDVGFCDVGVSLIKQWESKMRKDGISNTTIGMYLRACRVVVNASIHDRKLKRMQYPFGKDNGLIKIKKGRSRSDEFLDIATIKTIMNFTPPNNWYKNYADVVDEAIAFWVFSYLGNGLNLADMAYLRYDKHYFESGMTELKFVRQKTIDTADEDIEVIIPLIPEIKSIIKKHGSPPEFDSFVFPQILQGESDPETNKKSISRWNSNIRDRLRAACKVLGIEKTPSMTWARHSFATNLTIAGISERYIGQAMGHTKKSVTQGYIGLFPPDKRMEFNKLLLE
jgi:integrase